MGAKFIAYKNGLINIDMVSYIQFVEDEESIEIISNGAEFVFSKEDEPVEYREIKAWFDRVIKMKTNNGGTEYGEFFVCSHCGAPNNPELK